MHFVFMSMVGLRSGRELAPLICTRDLDQPDLDAQVSFRLRSAGASPGFGDDGFEAGAVVE
jgi:hypothetical protein